MTSSSQWLNNTTTATSGTTNVYYGFNTSPIRSCWGQPIEYHELVSDPRMDQYLCRRCGWRVMALTVMQHREAKNRKEYEEIQRTRAQLQPSPYLAEQAVPPPIRPNIAWLDKRVNEICLEAFKELAA